MQLNKLFAILLWVGMGSVYLYIMSLYDLNNDPAIKISFEDYLYGFALFGLGNTFFLTVQNLIALDGSVEHYWKGLIKHLLITILGFIVTLIGFYMAAFGGAILNLPLEIVGYAVIFGAIYLIYDQAFKAERAFRDMRLSSEQNQDQ